MQAYDPSLLGEKLVDLIPDAKAIKGSESLGA